MRTTINCIDTHGLNVAFMSLFAGALRSYIPEKSIAIIKRNAASIPSAALEYMDEQLSALGRGCRVWNDFHKWIKAQRAQEGAQDGK